MDGTLVQVFEVLVGLSHEKDSIEYITVLIQYNTILSTSRIALNLSVTIKSVDFDP